ncbi:MAG TPA: DUF6263 family protein [Mucilaginibacter sp.]|nr:DUF6263 family protein [Mucilaginibacter sp.]
MKKTLTLLLLLAGATCYAQKTKLQLNLQQDSTYYLTTNSNLTITETIQGQPFVVNMIASGKAAHKVTAIKDTTYEMTVQFEKLVLHMDLAGRVMDMDSENDGQDIFSKIMKAMLHKAIIIIISKNGKVLDLKNTDNLNSGIFEKFPDLPEEKKAQIKAQLQNSFGPEYFKTGFQDAFAMFTQNEIGINDTWTATTKIKAFAMANVKTTYIMQAITNKTCKVHGDAVISSSGSSEYGQINGMPTRMDNIIGTTAADYTLDKATGWIIEAKVVKTIKGDAKIKDNPKVPGGMEFPIAMTADFTMVNK